MVQAHLDFNDKHFDLNLPQICRQLTATTVWFSVEKVIIPDSFDLDQQTEQQVLNRTEVFKFGFMISV